MERQNDRIAIVGGGITGLFCAYVLEQHGHQVELFESTERLGGRIRTVRLAQDSTPIDPKDWANKSPHDLEFYAEFGPMRLELDKQLLLKALLNTLGIVAEGQANFDPKACLVDFPSYSSPESPHDPQYDLRSNEVGKSPLQLLRLALLCIAINLEDVDVGQQRLFRQVTMANTMEQSIDALFTNWLQELKPSQYWEIQQKATIDGVPLYAMGFWNLLSDYLSHDAINKIRDVGTFYHLLPENPNAAEWFVWWLIGLGSKQRLQGISGGMEAIVEKMVAKLQVAPVTSARVSSMQRNGEGKLSLVFDPDATPKTLSTNSYDRVILAIPKSPLEQIVAKTEKAVFGTETAMPELPDAAFGFPMVKLFVVVKNRWWEEEYRANRYATRMPTRELHYWKGRTKDSRKGMFMGYSDRPASAFWANYVLPGKQADVETGKQPADGNWEALSAGRLLKKVLQYIHDNDVPDITSRDIEWYGIRDWSRAPYGGANHAWRPERKYWIVMRRLAEIGAAKPNKPSIHVCGEAYSDYHGFMEGSLRSAVYVLHRILDPPRTTKAASLAWLSDHSKGRLTVESNYLEALRDWAERLDDVKITEAFV